jgi:hypothetical protein
VNDSQVELSGGEELTAGRRLGLPLRGEVNIVPAGKEVGNIPLRLAVANEN